MCLTKAVEGAGRTTNTTEGLIERTVARLNRANCAFVGDIVVLYWKKGLGWPEHCGLRQGSGGARPSRAGQAQAVRKQGHASAAAQILCPPPKRGRRRHRSRMRALPVLAPAASRPPGFTDHDPAATRRSRVTTPRSTPPLLAAATAGCRVPPLPCAAVAVCRRCRVPPLPCAAAAVCRRILHHVPPPVVVHHHRSGLSQQKWIRAAARSRGSLAHRNCTHSVVLH